MKFGLRKARSVNKKRRYEAKRSNSGLQVMGPTTGLSSPLTTVPSVTIPNPPVCINNRENSVLAIERQVNEFDRMNVHIQNHTAYYQNNVRGHALKKRFEIS